jgi:Predicted ATPase (AAA+ superfamily)
MDYKGRIIDRLLSEKLEERGAVLVEGPKACGKTTSSKRVARTVFDFGNITEVNRYKMVIENEPSLAFKDRNTPILIDEWQVFPSLWDSIRHEVDERGECGQFIMTGSTSKNKRIKTVHSGTGRIGRLRMSTMSLWETGDSDGTVSIEELFNGCNKSVFSEARQNLSDIAYLCCRGGWPSALGKDVRVALAQARDYLDEVCSSDINLPDGVRKSEYLARALLRSYARHSGTQARLSRIIDDLGEIIDTPSDNTIRSYLSALNEIFVIDDLKAWNPNLRSAAAIRTSDTRYFVDSSLATAALGIGPEDIIQDTETGGFIFETLCIHDLKVYASALDAEVYHYRDADNRECDAVIHRRNGTYGLIEIKLGQSRVEDGVKSLLKVASLIDDSRMGKPSFLMVLTGTGAAYRRPDGVYVVPIGCLKN